jgi:ABC-2 type transport system permease protein
LNPLFGKQQMKALYFKEIRSFLSSIIGYIFILIYLIASGLFHWIISENTNLLEGTEADLIPFFNLSPVIFLILIPAITMRSIAEERRTGTIELLFTRPISDLKILLAKYFAGVSLLLVALIPTSIYYVSMHYLGSPVGIIDDGATFTSYLGLILLGATFVAIGTFASALTSSQIVAFILAMFLCWLFYDGFGLLGSYNLMGQFDSILQYCGISYHYEAIKKGVIDTKNIVYFISIIVLFIYAALTVIKSLKK